MTLRTKIEVLVALLAAGIIWYYATPKLSPVQQWQPAKVAPQIALVHKQDIVPPKVSVYMPVAKRKLDLPAVVQEDPHSYVLDSVRLPSDRHPQTVTTLIDEQTGQTETLVRREPLPWLAAEQTGEARVDIGIKNGMARVGRLTLREDLLQVKALHAGLNASIDTDGQFFAGAGIGYRW